jgi:hypothetical protein
MTVPDDLHAVSACTPTGAQGGAVLGTGPAVALSAAEEGIGDKTLDDSLDAEFGGQGHVRR